MSIPFTSDLGHAFAPFHLAGYHCRMFDDGSPVHSTSTLSSQHTGYITTTAGFSLIRGPQRVEGKGRLLPSNLPLRVRALSGSPNTGISSLAKKTFSTFNLYSLPSRHKSLAASSDKINALTKTSISNYIHYLSIGCSNTYPQGS